MTTIVALEKNGEVFFGADTQVTSGNQRNTGALPKLFTNAGTIFGIAGRVEVSQAIQHAKLPKFAGTGSEEEFIVTKLFPAIRSALKAADVAPMENSTIKLGNSMIVCVNHRAFQVSSELALLRTTNGMYAVGSGAKYALGALHAGATIQKAIKIASELDIYTNSSMTEASSN